MLILIADDELRLRKIIALYMRKCGHTVIEAESGEIAIEYAREKKPDIIVLDVIMQNMSGIDVTKYIKNEPDLKDIPIILLTGNASDIDKKIGEEHGVDKYISKPFSPKELLETIEKLVNK